jgi:hypothetical protein
MKYYLIAEQQQLEILVPESMMIKKMYLEEFSVLEASLPMVGMLTNGKSVFQAALSDAQYLPNHCVTNRISYDELWWWCDEFGYDNVITSLEGLEFKEVKNV